MYIYIYTHICSRKFSRRAKKFLAKRKKLVLLFVQYSSCNMGVPHPPFFGNRRIGPIYISNECMPCHKSVI